MALHTVILHRMDALIWKIYAFEIPYVSGGVRKGLLVCVKNGEGEEKWAEVSPLPGRSTESLEQAFDQLRALLSGQPVEEILPSVQFALEHLAAPTVSSITARLYALLSGTPKEILKQAEIAKKLGYGTLKVKVSSLYIEDAWKVLNTLKNHFRLRVDCNCKFSFTEALSLFAPFDPSLFDYIEDPTYEIARLPEFTHPFALDETLTQFRSLSLEDCPHFYGFILKPTLLGGEKGCAPFIQYAKEHKRKVVFSPAFESGVGLLQILCLAKRLNLLEDLLGLDTHRFLKHDVLKPPVNFSTPQFTVAAPLQIDHQYLSEIAHGTNYLSPL